MVDTDSVIRLELDRLAPAGEVAAADWDQVLRRAGLRPSARRLRLVLAAVATAAVMIGPAVALSAGVRSFLGLQSEPSPRYAQARLVVSAPLPGGRVARLWVAPSTQGGECEFVTYDPADSRRSKPLRMTGGGACTIGAHPLSTDTLTWTFSIASPTTPPLIEGRTHSGQQASRVELRWHGGSRLLATRNGYFIGAAPELTNPPFQQLPYDLVVLNNHGHILERARIPTSILYRDWKHTQPRLHHYRLTHHCGQHAIWNCDSR